MDESEKVERKRRERKEERKGAPREECSKKGISEEND